MYEKRSYRNWSEDRGLISFEVKIKTSDLFIRADCDLSKQAEMILREERRVLEDYIKTDPQFAESLRPYAVKPGAPEIAREMAQAAWAAGVGPMAAVAGAISEYVGKKLLAYTKEIIVENGGDIFISTNKPRKVGIFAGESTYTGKLALKIAPLDSPLGICTSSGKVGPSLSFGQADAAIVVAKSALLADAWATSLGNMVKEESDIEKALEFVKDKPDIKGVILIFGDKIGAQGGIELVKI